MLLETLLSSYIDQIAKVLRRFHIRLGPLGFGPFVFEIVEQEAERTLDERIATIDAARQNLLDGVKAIDELKEEATRNKEEVVRALRQIALLEKERTELNEEIQASKTVLETDVGAFRKIAGVPSTTEIRRERIIGFISGVIASLVAAGLIYLGKVLITLIT